MDLLWWLSHMVSFTMCVKTVAPKKPNKCSKKWFCCVWIRTVRLFVVLLFKRTVYLSLISWFFCWVKFFFQLSLFYLEKIFITEKNSLVDLAAPPAPLGRKNPQSMTEIFCRRPLTWMKTLLDDVKNCTRKLREYFETIFSSKAKPNMNAFTLSETYLKWAEYI